MSVIFGPKAQYTPEFSAFLKQLRPTLDSLNQEIATWLHEQHGNIADAHLAYFLIGDLVKWNERIGEFPPPVG